jgi:hypothetical protein
MEWQEGIYRRNKPKDQRNVIFIDAKKKKKNAEDDVNVAMADFFFSDKRKIGFCLSCFTFDPSASECAQVHDVGGLPPIMPKPIRGVDFFHQQKNMNQCFRPSINCFGRRNCMRLTNRNSPQKKSQFRTYSRRIKYHSWRSLSPWKYHLVWLIWFSYRRADGSTCKSKTN